MRIHSMFVTILLALFAAIGFLYEKNLHLEIWDLSLKFAILIHLFGIFGTYLFYFIDRYWYHRLLVGSVKHAIYIETKYKSPHRLLVGSVKHAIYIETKYKSQ